MKPLIAVLAGLTFATVAHAGPYATCMNGLLITAYGTSAPSPTRQCFFGRYSQSLIVPPRIKSGLAAE